jgi:hypothetical protein
MLGKSPQARMRRRFFQGFLSALAQAQGTWPRFGVERLRRVQKFAVLVKNYFSPWSRTFPPCLVLSHCIEKLNLLYQPAAASASFRRCLKAAVRCDSSPTALPCQTKSHPACLSSRPPISFTRDFCIAISRSQEIRHGKIRPQSTAEVCTLHQVLVKQSRKEAVT